MRAMIDGIITCIPLEPMGAGTFLVVGGMMLPVEWALVAVVGVILTFAVFTMGYFIGNIRGSSPRRRR